MFQSLIDSIVLHVPKLLGAMAVLAGGWFAALFISSIIKAGLKKTKLNEKLKGWLRSEDAEGEKQEKDEAIEVEEWIARIVFWLAMLFVFVGFFQTLGLTIITQPLNTLLTKLFDFAPRLLAAGALFTVAWVVATLLRFIVTRAMKAANFEKRLGEEAGLEESKEVPLTKTLAESVYWLVFLLFLPAVLNALSLEGLLQPVQEMINKVLAYLPNLMAAGMILVAGWFVARILQRIVSNLLAAAGTDKLTTRLGMEKALGEKKLSALLGLVVYALVLIPVLVASLNALKLDAITQPASRMLDQLLSALPAILGAVLVLGLAYMVGKFVTALVSNLLAGAGFDSILVHLSLAREPGEGKKAPSAIVGKLALVTIVLFASIEAADLLGFEGLSAQLESFIAFGSKVILGLIIFGLGLFLANLASQTVLASGTEQSKLLAIAARISIIVLTGAMAVRRMGLADDIINLAFGLGLGAIAIAIAIAFGIGGREAAGRELDGWLKSLKKPGA